MAEELAKTRLGLKNLKLVNCLKAVKLTITVHQGSITTPSEKLLTRQVTHLKAAWEVGRSMRRLCSDCRSLQPRKT